MFSSVRYTSRSGEKPGQGRRELKKIEDIEDLFKESIQHLFSRI